MVHGAWCMVHFQVTPKNAPWSYLANIAYIRKHKRCMVHGAWCMVHELKNRKILKKCIFKLVQRMHLAAIDLY
jgi:hypothetical protein